MTLTSTILPQNEFVCQSRKSHNKELVTHNSPVGALNIMSILCRKRKFL